MNSSKEFDFSHLKHFYSVTFYRGFSRASRATGLSQPALSTGLKKLETELGTKLIQRNSSEFTLTPEGASLFEFCQEMELRWSGVRTAISPANEKKIHRFRVGTSPSVGYHPVVRFFSALAERPNPVRADITLKDSHSLVEMLQEGALDIAFLPDDVPVADLKLETFTKESMVLIASGENNLSLRGDHWKKKLAEETLVTYPRETAMRSRIDRILIRERIRFRSEIAVDGIESMRLLVLANIGVAFVQKSLVEDALRTGTLREISFHHIPLPKFSVSLAYRSIDPELLKSLRASHSFEHRAHP